MSTDCYCCMSLAMLQRLLCKRRHCYGCCEVAAAEQYVHYIEAVQRKENRTEMHIPLGAIVKTFVSKSSLGSCLSIECHVM